MSIQQVPIELGKTLTLRSKTPIKFVIETIQGTTVKGIISANHSVEVTPQKDIKNIELIIDDEPRTGIERIK